jgi:hypothetical protein
MDSPLKVLYMNRRLRLAAEPQTGRREVSALTDARKTLAYDFSEFCGLPTKRAVTRRTEKLAKCVTHSHLAFLKRMNRRRQNTAITPSTTK